MVDMSISHIVSEAPTAKDAWQALQDRFDRRNSTTLYTSVKSFFTSMSMTDSTTMLDHINRYENYLRQLVQRCKDTSSDDLYQHLVNYLSDEKIKSHHLLMTLPESMANIVDNLQSKVDLTYLDVHTRLLELASSSVVDTPKKNKALSAKSWGKNTQSTIHQQPNPTHIGKTVPTKGNQCSWCKSRNFPFDGHTFKTCQKLKNYQASSFSSQQQRPTQTTGREVVLYRASTAQKLFSSNGLAHLVISRPSSHSASVNVPTQVSANYTIYEVWIFDTGASFHITADFSHLLNPVHCHVGLTVGGRRVMYATHQGNVVLSLEVPSDVLSLTLIDVLYVPD